MKHKIISKTTLPCGCIQYIRQNHKGQAVPTETLLCQHHRDDGTAATADDALEVLMGKACASRSNRIKTKQIPVKYSQYTEYPVYVSSHVGYNYWVSCFLAVGCCGLFLAFILAIVGFSKKATNTVNPVTSPHRDTKWETSNPWQPQNRPEDWRTTPFGPWSPLIDNIPSMQTNEVHRANEANH